MRELSVSYRQLIEFLTLVLVVILAYPSRVSLLVGSFLSLVGLGLRMLASGFKYSENEFMVRGTFRYVRHPHSLGSLLVAIGLCVAANNFFLVIIVFLLLGLFFRMTLRAEEDRLVQKWGPRYGLFRANVAPITPQLFPVVPAGGEGRKFALKDWILRGNRKELNAVISVLITLLIIYLFADMDNRRVYLIAVLSGALILILFRFIYYRKKRLDF
ncbi:MAG: methyltransferase [Bdellovibrionota bacterium]